MSRASEIQELVRALRAGARRLEEHRGAVPGRSRAAAPDEAGGPDEPAVTSTFLRGLVAGALVGAAIAGSTVWQRRRVRDRIRRELSEPRD